MVACDAWRARSATAAGPLPVFPLPHLPHRRCVIGAVACGTANYLSRGLRTQDPGQACWCVIKHALRPLDGMFVSNGVGLRTFAMCGVGLGLAAAIAWDSETHRHLGALRYAYLKASPSPCSASVHRCEPPRHTRHFAGCPLGQHAAGIGAIPRHRRVQ